MRLIWVKGHEDNPRLDSCALQDKGQERGH